MRIGSSGDWHLDCGLDADIERSVHQIAKVFRDGNVDMIALPGDLFDRKSTPEGRNLLRALIQEMAEIAPVIICYGNHEEPGDLDIFGQVRSKFSITVFDRPDSFCPASAYGPDCMIHVLPWFTKSTWQAAHAGESKEEGDIAVSRLAMDFLKQAVYLSPKDRKHVLISHLTIDGARLENHQPFKGEGIKFGRYDLEEVGFYAGILGHIHLRQQFEEASPLFFYNGSPAALDYGESPEKYCSILDTNGVGVEWYRLETVDRFSLELEWGTGISRFEASYLGITGVRERIPGARVRALLKVPEGEDIAHAKAEVERMIMEAGALETKVEPQVVPKTLVRSVDISSAERLPDKLDAYWKANDNYPSVEDQQGMKMKLTALETGSVFRST